ncbi:MAG: proline--tRNA ligase, partial [Nanoarchaeota archaeon]
VKKEQDFSEWYVQVVRKAELADYSAVKGCMIIKPHAYSIWENIQSHFNKQLKNLNVKNAYFPLFIPESFFKKEAEHAKGFSPEVAWISNTEEGERLAIRPTSETIMYDSFSKWIRSHRDLPLRINQWSNVVRWDTKAIRLFIRTREFLWQEGHCVYETEKECEKETLLYLNEYKKLCETMLAIPILAGKKSEKEKFAGAVYTLSIDALMPDGKALQMGTSHNLGQDFAKSFNIRFLGKDEKEHVPWQNSWGISTRLIGAMVMTHGDDKGLVIPPNIATTKIVIIPIFNEKTKEKILKKANEIKNKLNKYNPILDDRDHTPGWKYNEWELKGIPIRIEIGPKDLEKKQVVLVRRDTSQKKSVKITNLLKEAEKTLKDIQDSLFNKAKKLLDQNTVYAKSLSDLKKAIQNRKLAKIPWCGSVECEDNIKDQTEGAKIINIPFEQPKSIKDNCAYCNKKAKNIVHVAKSY